MQRKAYSGMAVLLSGLLVLAGGCGGRSGSRLYRQGLAQLRGGDAAAAARTLKRASARLVDSAPLYYHLGAAYYRLENLDGAREAFAAALELDPTDTLSQEYLGQIHLQRHEWAQARERFAQAAAARTGPEAARAFTAAAVAEQGDGRLDVACLRLIQALRADPRYAPAHYNLASLCRDKFQLYGEAIDRFELFTRLVPAGDAHIAKARASMERLRALEGGAARPPVRRDPAAAARAFQEGETLRAAHQWSRADVAYNRALAADPLHVEAAYAMGLTASSRGDPRQAGKAFQRAAELAPGRIDPLYQQARVAYDSRNYALAAQVVAEQILPRWHTHAPSIELLALARNAQRRFAEARLFGEYYLELTPGGPRRLQFAAWVDSLPR